MKYEGLHALNQCDPFFILEVISNWAESGLTPA